MSGRDGQAAAWSNLGYAHHRLGHYQEAVSCQLRALDLYGDTGDRHNRADALIYLGDAHEDHGDHLSAQDAWVKALAILDEIGHPDAEDVRARLRVE
jgi:tetratricopeptide (TPR) repeat protein